MKQMRGTWLRAEGEGDSTGSICGYFIRGWNIESGQGRKGQKPNMDEKLIFSMK